VARRLRGAPHRATVAEHRQWLVAPPIGMGVESDDVRGKQTTPPAWHQSDRPRVIARQKWLEERARK